VSETRANDVEAAVALVRQAMEKITHLDGPPGDEVTVDGIRVVLQDVIRRIEALGDQEGE
jgi:hypothetical protein